MRNGLIVAAVVVFLGLAYFLFRDELIGRSAKPAPEVQPAAEALDLNTPPPLPIAAPSDTTAEEKPAPSPPEPAGPPPEPLPSLADSDDLVREALDPFGLPTEWTSQMGLVRRLAVLIDAVPRGEWPRRPLRFLKSPSPFEVVARDGRIFADPDNAARFDPGLDLLEHIDPADAAGLLARIEPLVEAALGELGAPVGDADPILDAIDAVLETPDTSGEFELVRPKVLYEYADPALETLPAFDKQLLRLGSANVARLKTYLGRLRVEWVREAASTAARPR